MAKTVHRLDEEEKKIIDLIRKHKLDYIDVKYLFELGIPRHIKLTSELKGPISSLSQRDLDKYTKLLQSLEENT